MPRRVQIVDGSLRDLSVKSIVIRSGAVTSKYLIALSKKQYDAATHDVIVNAPRDHFFIADDNQSRAIVSWLFDWDRHAHYSAELDKIAFGLWTDLCCYDFPVVQEVYASDDPAGWLIRFEWYAQVSQGEPHGRMVLVNTRNNTYRDIKLIHMHDIDSSGPPAAGSHRKRQTGGAAGAGGKAHKQSANVYMIV